MTFKQYIKRNTFMAADQSITLGQPQSIQVNRIRDQFIDFNNQDFGVAGILLGIVVR